MQAPDWMHGISEETLGPMRLLPPGGPEGSAGGSTISEPDESPLQNLPQLLHQGSVPLWIPKRKPVEPPGFANKLGQLVGI